MTPFAHPSCAQTAASLRRLPCAGRSLPGFPAGYGSTLSASTSATARSTQAALRHSGALLRGVIYD